MLFSFFSLNARSLLNKFDELPSLIQTCHPLPTAIAITETWCSSPLEGDSLSDLPYYSLYCCDRQQGRGGGCLVYIHSSTTHSPLSMYDVSGYESVWIELTLPNCQSFVFGVSYRPPSSDIHHYCASLESCLCRASPKPMVLVGDFSAKNTSWLSTDPADSAWRALQALLLTYGLTEHVNFPTHAAGGILNSCIDLVAASDTLHPTSVHPLPPLCNSDHLAILGILELPTRPTPIIAAVQPRSWSWIWDSDRDTELIFCPWSNSCSASWSTRIHEH